jgi:hypothetical protein
MIPKKEFDLLMRRKKRAIKRYKEGKTNNICGCDECVENRGEE